MTAHTNAMFISFLRRAPISRTGCRARGRVRQPVRRTLARDEPTRSDGGRISIRVAFVNRAN